MRPIDADAFSEQYGSYYAEEGPEEGFIGTVGDLIAKQPTIEPEVRRVKRCEYCKGRSYTKKPLTVITRTMKRVNVCFNFCPNCGRDMRATDTNVGSKGGADNAE